MQKGTLITFAIRGFVVGAGVLLGAATVIAWTGPTGTPPNSNVAAPINVGSASQVKNGALGVNSLAVYGNASVAGSISTDEGVIRDAGGGWVRTYGNTGWYSQTYGGGWYMVDTTWLRSYNNKSIYTGTGIVRSDGGLQVGSSGSLFDVASNGNVKVGGTLTVNGVLYDGGNTSYYIDPANYSRMLNLFVTSSIEIAGAGAFTSNADAGFGKDIYAPGLPSGNGHFVCWNDNGTGRLRHQSASCATSDARLKEHIKPIQAGLAEILKLNPVTFEWKNKTVDGEGTKLGLIAQEVKEVFPEVVTGAGTGVDGDWYGVDYGALTAPMIKAIQELKAENDDLRKELKELRALVESK